MTVDILGELKKRSLLVDAALADYLPAKGSADVAEINELYEMLWDYNLRGGKRLRPALCMLSCAMFGGKEEDALPTAAALELLQNFLLIHDDIQDESLLRRGKPCLHRIHGVAHAVNAGDSLFMQSFAVLLSNKRGLGASKTMRLMGEFLRQLDFTVKGQAMEIGWTRANMWDLQDKDYYRLVEYKTAHYTATTPMRLGAIIANARAADLTSIDRFGLALGTAFQIQDDVLNLAGEEGKYGKEAAGDIAEGKRTLALLHLFRKAGKEKEKLIGIMNKPRGEKTKEDVEYVLNLMEEKKSIEYAKEKARDFAEQAKGIFAKKFSQLPESGAKEFIKEMPDFVVNRQA